MLRRDPQPSHSEYVQPTDFPIRAVTTAVAARFRSLCPLDSGAGAHRCPDSIFDEVRTAVQTAVGFRGTEFEVVPTDCDLKTAMPPHVRRARSFKDRLALRLRQDATPVRSEKTSVL